MKTKILIALIFSTSLIFSQEKSSNTKTISGYLSGENYELVGATVKVKEKNKGVVTDKSGYYEIKVEVGQTLEYSFLGYISKETMVTDSDSVISIELSDEAVILDEVVLKSSVNSSEYLLDRKDRIIINQSYNYISQKRLLDLERKGAFDVIEVLLRVNPNFKRSFNRRTGFDQVQVGRGVNDANAIWNVDGIPYRDFIPSLDFKDIKYIAIMRGPYVHAGTLADNGTIIIKTGARMEKEKFENVKRKSSSYR